MKDFQGVIFDLDGTLIDSLGDIAAACNRTLKGHGLPEHPIGAYRHFIGDGVGKLISRALPEGRRTDQALNDSCLKMYAQDYGQAWKVTTSLYSGVMEMLDGLTKLNIKMAVLSNEPDGFTKVCVGEFLSKWRFEVVLGAGGSFAHKPDPSSALYIAGRMGFSAERIIYAGDMPVDMYTAKNAGMFGVGVSWGLRSDEELKLAGAKMVIHRPSEIIALIE